jgi:hypothetical protein
VLRRHERQRMARILARRTGNLDLRKNIDISPLLVC